MASIPVSKFIQTESKPSTRPNNNKPVLIAEYSTKEGKGFSIVIPTRIKKQRNHYIYGDKVEKILSQAHEYYEMPEKKQKNESIQREGKLVKSIKLSMGDGKSLKNDKYLINEVFPKMTELRLAENSIQKNAKYLQKISLEIKWKNSSKVDTLKVSYMKEYEPDIFDEYNNMRAKYQEKWKQYLKSYDKRETLQKNHKIQDRGMSMEKIQKYELKRSNGHSLDKLEIISINNSEQKSNSYSKPSISNEKSFSSSSSYQSVHEQIDSTDFTKPAENNLKRKASFSMEKSYQSNSIKRKLLKQQTQPFGRQINISEEVRNSQIKRQSIFIKPTFIGSILERHKSLKSALERSGFLSNSITQNKKENVIFFQNKQRNVSGNLKTQENRNIQEKLSNFTFNIKNIKNTNSSNPVQKKIPIVIEIDDD